VDDTAGRRDRVDLREAGLPALRRASTRAGTLSGGAAAPERQRIAARLRVVGSAVGWPADIETRPAAWRDTLAVRFVPTTLWVQDDGRVSDAWLGARSAAAWRQAMTTHFSRDAGAR
jgi:hypothetical protein